MLLILKMIADESIPIQTIAPRFSGRFNKGVDYVGDVSDFEREFEKDILVLNYAMKHFALPAGLKLSVHSGSDKFSLYPVINRLLKKHGQGVHLKTAGTTWLEEVVGLAASGTEAFGFVCRLYENALERIDELTAPYADVIDIDKRKLPQAKEVKSWSGECFARALRHDPGESSYNSHLRQLIHVAYKLAAENKAEFIELILRHRKQIGIGVSENILERHIKPLFD